ncbi:MAG TPA: hypothetical protein ENL35_06245, partial [Chloroflexi bacterium]|nr:hypothetical protein [Chloroflexota bacterium]
MSPPLYGSIVKAKDKAFRYDIRRKLVADALKDGIKPTARAWGCSRNTVRLWLRRFKQQGWGALKEVSHAPGSCPHRTSPELEKRVVELRTSSGFGPLRLKMEFDLPCSKNAIARIVRQHGLARRRKTKRQKNNDLRAVKALLKPFETVQMDVKYLNDIPHYLPQMRAKPLPRFQYTIRDVRTGLLFLAYADQLSKTNACLAVQRFLAHLHSWGIETTEVTIQTDNGGEFDGQTITPLDRGFSATIEAAGAAQRFIPPGCPNANADVETTHNLIETEFFDRESFRNRRDFFGKVATWQLYFNAARKNSYQRWKTPLERLAQAAPQIDPRMILLVPSDLDTLMAAGPARRPSDVSAWAVSDTHKQSVDQLIALYNKHPPGGQHQPGHPAWSPQMRGRAAPAAGMGAGHGVENRRPQGTSLGLT